MRDDALHLYTWGRNRHGVLGHGDDPSSSDVVERPRRAGGGAAAAAGLGAHEARLPDSGKHGVRAAVLAAAERTLAKGTDDGRGRGRARRACVARRTRGTRWSLRTLARADQLGNGQASKSLGVRSAQGIRDRAEAFAWQEELAVHAELKPASRIAEDRRSERARHRRACADGDMKEAARQGHANVVFTIELASAGRRVPDADRDANGPSRRNAARVQQLPLVVDRLRHVGRRWQGKRDHAGGKDAAEEANDRHDGLLRVASIDSVTSSTPVSTHFVRRERWMPVSVARTSSLVRCNRSCMPAVVTHSRTCPTKTISCSWVRADPSVEP